MLPIIVYVFFAITNGSGYEFGSHLSMEECQKDRLAVKARPDSLFLSECRQFTLMPEIKSKT